MATAEANTNKLKGVPRGKFATPPVKLACLACRAARVRCDGNQPCKSCSKKGRECAFPAQSRRGGPRVHRSTRHASRLDDGRNSHIAEQISLTPQRDKFFEQSSMIDPGAGLKRLDDEFADIDKLLNPMSPSTINSSEPVTVVCPQAPQLRAQVRAYGSTQSLLNGYYTWLHPFFPILPPPISLPIYDEPLSWSSEPHYGQEAYITSPLGLAISALLCLIPLPHTEDQPGQDNTGLRRHHAQILAKRTMEGIENDSELPDSATFPARALLLEQNSSPRQPFHPHVPVELESIIALCLLSVYEYAQRGNLRKMRDRAGQALVSAMDQSLHCRDSEDGEFAEARRRIWWMTYVCVCQASIVSCTSPTISAYDSRFTTPFPTLKADQESWPFFIQSQQIILSATQFVRQLDRSMDTKTGLQSVRERMHELHETIDELINRTKTWEEDSACTRPVDHSEHVVATSLKAMSMIKLNSAMIKVHRFCAFSDIPVFSERHCDLKKAVPVSVDLQNHNSAALSTCCSTSLPISSFVDSSAALFAFPFTSQESSRICLKSALNIASAFELLPLPCPLSSSQETIFGHAWNRVPRTMPAFACCAMQSAYALLNLHHRAFVLIGSMAEDSSVSALLGQCEIGLRSVLISLSTFAISFEAISGMRGTLTKDKHRLQEANKQKIKSV